MKTKITLYGTSACHLCDQAFKIIQPIALSHDIAINLVDIVDNDALLDKYGLIIPVIAASEGEFLRWPFDIQQVSAFLAKIKN